jgi:hypothetical protein
MEHNAVYRHLKPPRTPSKIHVPKKGEKRKKRKRRKKTKLRSNSVGEAKFTLLFNHTLWRKLSATPVHLRFPLVPLLFLSKKKKTFSKKLKPKNPPETTPQKRGVPARSHPLIFEDSDF